MAQQAGRELPETLDETVRGEHIEAMWVSRVEPHFQGPLPPPPLCLGIP